MSDVHLFTEIPLELVLKSQKLKIQLKGDLMGEVCSEGLNECALYLNIYINDALTAKTESDAVKTICHAYQKTASTKYYMIFCIIVFYQFMLPKQVNYI